MCRSGQAKRAIRKPVGHLARTTVELRWVAGSAGSLVGPGVVRDAERRAELYHRDNLILES